MYELRKGPGFPDEALQTPQEGAPPILRERPYLAVALADGELHRQVFLDGDLPAEIRVGGEVSDAEAALAQHVADPVPVQPVALRQGIAVRLGTHGPEPRIRVTRRLSTGRQAVGTDATQRPVGRGWKPRRTITPRAMAQQIPESVR